MRIPNPADEVQYEVLDEREPDSPQEPEPRTWRRRRIARCIGAAVSLTVFTASLLVWLSGPDEGRVNVLSRSLAVVSSAAFVAEFLVIRIIKRYGDDDHDDAVRSATSAQRNGSSSHA